MRKNIDEDELLSSEEFEDADRLLTKRKKLLKKSLKDTNKKTRQDGKEKKRNN